jgi:hypothetical protein
MQLRPLRLGLSDQSLLTLVFDLSSVDLGLLRQRPLVPETVNNTGAKSAVPEDLSGSLAGGAAGTIEGMANIDGCGGERHGGCDWEVERCFGGREVRSCSSSVEDGVERLVWSVKFDL